MQFSSKIAAIKVLKDQSSMSLKEAKDFVEAVMELGAKDKATDDEVLQSLALLEKLR